MDQETSKRNRMLNGFVAVAAASLLLATVGASAQIPSNLQAPPGNEIVAAARATGVQIYVSKMMPDGTMAWVFKAPEATLFEPGSWFKPFAIHYAGPTWEAVDGSTVVGSVLQRATVNPNAIPWLLLQAVSHSGDGMLSDVTYIQRLFAGGGIAPSRPPTSLGQEVRVRYVAIYVFWHAQQ